MITGQLRSKIDKLWEEFWTGGITNPLTVIEQISFLLFARLLDMRESTEEKKWSRKNPGKQFPGLYFPRDKQHLRWSQLKQEADGEKILKIVRDEVFPHFRLLGQQEELASGDGPKNTFNQYMKDATLMVNKPSLLLKAITMVDELPLTQGDTKGDLYEYLLSKLTTAGINGQFRTPRHIIQAITRLSKCESGRELSPGNYLVISNSNTKMAIEKRIDSRHAVYTWLGASASTPS